MIWCSKIEETKSWTSHNFTSSQWHHIMITFFLNLASTFNHAIRLNPFLSKIDPLTKKRLLWNSENKHWFWATKLGPWVSVVLGEKEAERSETSPVSTHPRPTKNCFPQNPLGTLEATKLIKVIKQKIKSPWEQVVKKRWVICPHTLQTT